MNQTFWALTKYTQICIIEYYPTFAIIEVCIQNVVFDLIEASLIR